MSLSKQSKIDLKTGKEHQQESSQLSEKICDGPVWAFFEKTDNMRSQYNSTKQQTNNGRQADSTTQPRNSEENCHPTANFARSGRNKAECSHSHATVRKIIRRLLVSS